MIKYRVYDNDQKKYLRPELATIDGTGVLRAIVDNLNSTRPEDKIKSVFQVDHEDCPRFIIEQYTGLKDKNGVEIAVGDIVKHRGYYGRAKNSAVEFNKGCFNTGEHDGSSTRKRPMLLQNNCEVIGNIHENADLLEKYKSGE